jgi:hypothetical protein
MNIFYVCHTGMYSLNIICVVIVVILLLMLSLLL